MNPAGPKVLHVFSTFGKGGPQVRAAALMGRFPGGARHFLVAMDSRTEALSLVPPGVTLEVLPPPEGKSFFRVSRFMKSFLLELGPDLVLTYNWGAIETLAGAMAAGLSRVVHHEEGFGPGETRKLFLRRNLARSFLFKGAAALVVPSRTLSRIARRKWKVPEEKLHYLPNGVDLERFRPGESARREGEDRPFRVGFLGGLRPEKNLGLLVRAFAGAKLPPGSQLLLGGSGPEEEALREEVRRCDREDRVLFEGAVEDAPSFYRKIDLFALSSSTEQMPLVVLEAMAAGLPILSTDVGDVKEMVSEPNRAFLVPPGDEPALARHMEALAADRDLREEVGRANRARCEEDFELEKCLGRYLDLYRKVLDRGR